MSRVLVAWCPDWPVTAVFGAGAGPGAGPGAASAASAGAAGDEASAAVAEAGRVVACSRAAREQGVRRGQRVRDAQRRCASLRVRDRDRDAEGRLFEAMATAMERITPRIEVLRPGVCACPARGAARYYGGEPALRDQVMRTAAEAGFSCGAGIADGVFAAWLAARTGDPAIVPTGGSADFLAPYPVGVLDSAELTDLLDRFGIRTLGALAALPAARVAERFGAVGTAAHRLARGLDRRPLSTRGPRADLSVATTFDPPARAAEQVIFAAAGLAERLHAGLAGAGLSCVRLSVEIEFSVGVPSVRLWRHEGSLAATAVAERVRWQLAGRDAGGGSPERPDNTVDGVTRLRLAPDQLVVDGGTQWALWGRPADAERAGRAAARVQAMLGHRAVLRPVAVGGRSPAQRVAGIPIGDIAAPQDVEAGGKGSAAERGGRSGAAGPWPGRVPEPAPAVVFGEPPPALLTDAAGAPVTVSGRCAVSAPPALLSVAGRPAIAVTAWTGPWPADEFWWDARRARRLARFQVVTSDDVAYLLACEKGEWHAEARYD